jgi:hypothetical protein
MREVRYERRLRIRWADRGFGRIASRVALVGGVIAAAAITAAAILAGA